MTTMPDDHPRPLQFSLRSLFVVVFCICLLLTIALPAIQASREAARCASCSSNLRQIGFALSTYADIWKQFPLVYREKPTGTPQLSWRLAIVPSLARPRFYERVDEDSAWNKQPDPLVYDINLFFMQCPTNSSKPTLTDYVAITGPGTAFPGPTKMARLSEMTDGTSHTIVVGHLVKSDIVWLEPRDLVFSQMSLRLNDGTKQSLSSQHPGGVPLLRADGSVLFYANGISPEYLKAWLTIAENEPEEMYELTLADASG